MPHFRKKPVVIEARQLDSVASLFEIMHWIDSHGGRTREWCWDDDDRYLTIRTLEGDHKAQAGDWVIKGVEDEFYPCKPAIFVATYEPATPSPQTVRLQQCRLAAGPKDPT
jgi:hypothetical protein